MAMRLRGGIAAAVLLLVLAESAVAESSPRKEKRVDPSLFEPKVELLSILLADPHAALTYEMSDMGPEADWVPKPIAYDANHGVYLVNPGPATAPEPTLQRFGVDGKRIFRTPLAPLLDVADPATLVSHRLFLGPAGESFLLYSTGYDPAAGLEKDFGIASFDAAGRRTANVKLAGFDWTDRAHRAPDGTLWAFRVKQGNHGGEWTACDPRGKKRFSLPGTSQGVALADGRLLLIAADAARHLSARVLDEDQHPQRVEVRGQLELGNEMIPGTGAFVASMSPDAGEAPDPAGLWLAASRLQLLHIATDGGVNRLEVVGGQSLRSTTAELDSKASVQRFELVHPLHLGPNGELYLVARRGPRNPTIVIYRMALRKDVRDRLAKPASASE